LGAGEADFSAGGAGFGSCPEAAWNGKKQTEMKASDRAKNMNGKGWTKTPVYLAERACNASNPQPQYQAEWGRIMPRKRMSIQGLLPDITRDLAIILLK
jgi:hypothetical protein